MTDKKQLTAEQRKKIETDRRRRQSITFRKKYGIKKYRELGSAGGKKSPTQWTSETARIAAEKSWVVRREREAAERQRKQNENGLQANEQK